jgi:DNA-binding HxlR family transcriptional regulator
MLNDVSPTTAARSEAATSDAAPSLAWRDLDSATCSIARTVALIGQPWMLLVLRDLFNGVRRFDELADHLGIARNVLTRRLAALVDAGLVERRGYREAGQRARSEYKLTPAGRDLRPVLLALMAYGDVRFAGPDGPPLLLEHRGCGGTVGVRLECSEGHPIEPETRLSLRPGPGARRRTQA